MKNCTYENAMTTHTNGLREREPRERTVERIGRKVAGIAWIAVSLISACYLTACTEKASEKGPWGGAEEARARSTKGKALFEERCRTIAGQKVYRSVPDVDGIVLLKVRLRQGAAVWADQMWPGAAFALEAGSEGYIETFLGYEVPLSDQSGKPMPVTPQNRGLVNTHKRSDGLRGYGFVDVVDEKDGQRYRYFLVEKPLPQSKIGSIATVLEKTPATGPAPRYGVTFEDHVVPEERALGVASSTVKVIDLQTKEVLGEFIRYVWSSGVPSTANPTPWLTAEKCPAHPVSVHSATRQFVDQVLLPRREK